MRARFLAAAACGLILAAGLASPARAETSGSVDAQVDAQVVALALAPSPGKAIPIRINAQNATNPLLTIDLAGLSGKATADAPPGCGQAAGKITCAFPTAPTFATVLPLVLHATSQATAADKQTLTLTTSADNQPPFARTYDVTFADAVDLVASPSHLDEIPAKIGDHVTIAASVRNVGSRSAKGIRLTWLADHGLVPDAYDNCVSVPLQFVHELVCDWPDVVLAPGQALKAKDQLGHDLALTVAPDTGEFEETNFTFTALSDAQAPPPAAAVAGHAGRTLDLVPAAATPPADVDADDNLAEVVYKIDGVHLDAAAIGATATGAVGHSVDVTVGFVDNGPAAMDVLRGGGEPAAILFFARPANAEIVGIPQSCDSVTFDGSSMAVEHKTGGDYYLCKSAGFVPVGVPQTVTFTLKVTASHGAAGTVNFTNKFDPPEARRTDDNPANDQADVVINTDSTGIATTPVSLPVTGAPLALIAGVGVVIVAVGAGLLLLGRRGRRRA